MESLVEQLNYYSKHGIPRLSQQLVDDDMDEGNVHPQWEFIAFLKIQTKFPSISCKDAVFKQNSMWCINILVNSLYYAKLSLLEFLAEAFQCICTIINLFLQLMGLDFR